MPLSSAAEEPRRPPASAALGGGRAIFYAQQFGSWEPQVFAPRGYPNLIPRLIAWLASGVSPANIPLFYNLSAIVINAFLIAYAATRMSPLFGLGVTLGAFFSRRRSATFSAASPIFSGSLNSP